MVVGKNKFACLVLTLIMMLFVDAKADELVDKGNGTIFNQTTGLIWQKTEGGKRTWEGAIVYCENLILGGFEDWRLPDINELRSLVDRSKYNPAIDKIYFPDITPSVYWSSSTPPSHNDYAWFVSFHTGNVNNYSKSYSYYVRCVRGSFNRFK